MRTINPKGCVLPSRAMLGINPIPPSPRLCQGSQHSTYPGKCHGMGTKFPLRPSRGKSRCLAWVWLRVRMRRESRLLPPRLGAEGAKKQLKILTAGSVTGSRS